MSRASIGTLRHRVTLESAARAADGGGGAVETWIPVAELWAMIRPLSGDERVAADGPAGTVSHEIVIRQRTGVVPAMRLRLGTRLFEIRAVMDVGERRRRLSCLCAERDL